MARSTWSDRIGFYPTDEEIAVLSVVGLANKAEAHSEDCILRKGDKDCEVANLFLTVAQSIIRIREEIKDEELRTSDRDTG